MPYLIYAIDKENVDSLREKLRSAHRAHLESVGSRLLASGALLSDDGSEIIGGISLLDTNNREDAEKFAKEDPYSQENIRKNVHIIRWRRRWLDGKFLGDIS